MSVSLKEQITALPDHPGVYIMKDAQGAVVYVGKAKSLKKRVVSYLGRDLAAKTMALMSRVADIEYRLTASEGFALLLEASLIHQYKPKYNISLRDDKSFPLVKITREAFPLICVTRKKEADGARYFGPYVNAGLLREALQTIRRHFPFRSCRKLPRQACMYYRIGLSPAPCIGKITQSEYGRTVKNIIMILEGKTEALIRNLSGAMHRLAGEKRFEQAAVLRDKILALASLRHEYRPPEEQIHALKDALGLINPPERIEAFDVSNLSGQQAAAAMVSFYKGRPDKNHYRRFKIKTISRVDDYAMLREAVRRRYTRVLAERLTLPDLILVDGGKGHLAAARGELRALGINVCVIGLAKEHERVYLADRGQPLKLASDSGALQLIRYIRDEAHRFAVKYHHLLRRKKLLEGGYKSS